MALGSAGVLGEGRYADGCDTDSLEIGVIFLAFGVTSSPVRCLEP
jgi:hypothetical protein